MNLLRYSNNKIFKGDGSISPTGSEKISRHSPTISPTCEQKTVQPPTHTLS